MLKYISYLILLGSSFCLQATVKIQLNDYNEWSIVHLAAAMLGKNPVVVQAGAHHRDTLGEMLWFWPEGTIHVFEPHPMLYQELKDWITQWNLRINLYPFALNERSGSALFYFDSLGINPRAGSLLQAAEDWKWYYKEVSTVAVDCQNLSEWARKNNISFIDFLWLNAGGLELRILQSITNLLPSIRFIVVETHFQEFRKGVGLYCELKPFLEAFDFEEIRHWHVPNFQGYAIFTKKGLSD